MEENKVLSKNIIGKTVVSKTGKRFGVVGDLVFETKITLEFTYLSDLIDIYSQFFRSLPNFQISETAHISPPFLLALTYHLSSFAYNLLPITNHLLPILLK